MVVETKHRRRCDVFIHGEPRGLSLWRERTHDAQVTNCLPCRVPKELISRFVKICPTCQVRRGGSRLTPPNSRRGSPRLEMPSRSPKLPSPPISRRESTFGAQMALDRAQSEYFTQLHGHGGWIDGHQTLQDRPSLTNGVRSSHAPIGNLSHSITGTLDFATDLSVPPSQLNYMAGYVPTYGTPTKREY